MQAQQSKPKPSNKHTNSICSIFSVISPASNLLLSPKTRDQFVQNEDSKEFPDLHLPICP